jgi:hypothetical protein
MAMNRASFPKDLEEGLNAHFGMSYTELPQEWKDVFDIESSNKAFEEDVQEWGLGVGAVKAEGGSVSYDEGGQGWTKRYTHITVALAFALTEEAIEDNLYARLGPKYSKSLARAMVEAKEIYCADILNRARNASYTGGDAKTLLATDHPLARGGSYSNVLATPAQISEASMEDLLIMIRKAKDDRGKPIALKPVKLIIPPEQEFAAARVLKTVYRPGTADNDINAAKVRRSAFYGSEPCIMTRLTDADAWFIKTDTDNGLKLFQRTKMQRGMEADFDTGNVRYKARERYSPGWTDPRGAYGSMSA